MKARSCGAVLGLLGAISCSSCSSSSPSDGASKDAAGVDGGKTELAEIDETASTNSPAIRVTVFDDASAVRTVGAPPQNGDRFEYPPGSPAVATFLTDLAAVGDVSQISTSPCAKSASFGTVTTVVAAGKTSGDMQCLSSAATAAAHALQLDIERLEGDQV
jgi:hypothetical protein